MSCAVYLAIGQTVFQHRLVNELSQKVPPDTVRQALSIGATKLSSIDGGQPLSIIIDGYSAAVTEVFFIPATALAISFLFVCGTKWTSVKKTKKEAQQVD